MHQHSTPPLGSHLVVGGRNLWLLRSGTGGPAVVFLSGAGAIGLDYLNVHQDAARSTTSVLYDRAGIGWSDPVELPRTAREVTSELRELLAAAGIPAPYLLVGHSLGGAYARHYAQRFPDEVAGLLLLDPLHEDSAKYWPEAVRQAGEQMKNMPLPELPDAVLDAYRGLFEQKFQTWPAAVREALVARHLAGWRAGFLEGRNMEEVCEELRAGRGTPEVPMTVVTTMAVDPAQRAFTPDEVQREVNAGKHTLNALLAGSVAGGRHLVLEDAAHAWVTMDQGDAVVEAIDDLLDRARG
jgi:pimeloyl-ACP methyl ester carboxylesterase